MYLFSSIIGIFGLTFIGLVTFLFLAPKFGKQKASLGCILAPILTVFFLILLNWWFSPVEPSRDDMMGRWEVHRKMYPGTNADWQRANFWIEITEKHLIVHDSIPIKPIKAKALVTWFVQPEYSFRIAPLTSHHLLDSGKLDIFRGHKGYYIVLKSSRYGNMFFERVSD